MNTFLGWIHAILPRFLSSFEKTSPHKRGGSFRPTHPSIVNTLLSASRKTLLAPKQVLLHANLGCTKKQPHENTQPINHKNLSKSAFPNQPFHIETPQVAMYDPLIFLHQTWIWNYVSPGHRPGGRMW